VCGVNSDRDICNHTHIHTHHLIKDNGERRMNVWQGEWPKDNTARDGYSRRAPVYAFKASERG
jgi:hypothetical protein